MWSQYLTPNIVIEIVKLILQLAGAIAIARLTVNWALKRYKAEKTWERRLSAYTEVVAAVSAMRLIADQWLDEALERRDVSQEYAERRTERYQKAQSNLEETAATASIVLGPAATQILQRLLSDLAKSDARMDWVGHLDEHAHSLQIGLEALQAEAHRVLG